MTSLIIHLVEEFDWLICTSMTACNILGEDPREHQ